MIRIIILLSLLISHSVIATANAFLCNGHYTEKKFQRGPLPEFLDQDYIILSAFDFNDFIYGTHRKIIASLPKNTKAMVLIPNTTDKESWLASYTKSYKETLAEDLFSFEAMVKSGRIELVEVPIPENFDSAQHGNWTRDFMSQLMVDKSGKVKFLNLKYHRESAEETDSWVQDYIIKKYQKELGYTIEKLDVPFFFEWGNFTTDGKGNFFISEKVFKINSYRNIVVSKTQVRQWVKETFGKHSKINWIKPPKDESTGHVDMFMKFLDSNRVLIASTEFKIWKKYLDDLAQTMKDKGYSVSRIEMAIDEPELEYNYAPFRSYTNSLIVGNRVYVPKYDSISDTLADKDKKAREVYRSLGYQVIIIDSSSSINAGGAAHCLTSTIPKLTQILPWVKYLKE